MTKNTKIVLLAAMGTVAFLIFIFVGRDLLLKSSEKIQCDDGERERIDIRDFITRYSAYAVEIEAAVGEKKLSAKLEPRLLQALSESMQHGNEFRKFLVAGYNACAITQAQFARYGSVFESLDAVSRQINFLADRPNLAEADRVKLEDLVNQFIALSEKLGRE